MESTTTVGADVFGFYFYFDFIQFYRPENLKKKLTLSKIALIYGVLKEDVSNRDMLPICSTRENRTVHYTSFFCFFYFYKTLFFLTS